MYAGLDMYPGSEECLLSMLVCAGCYCHTGCSRRCWPIYLPGRKLRWAWSSYPQYSSIVLCLYLLDQTTFARECLFIVLRGFEHLWKKLNMSWMIMTTNAGGR